MSNQSDEDVRNSIIGLGEKSVQKSYYPQLQRKIKEIEELNKSLEKKVDDRTKELSEQKNVFESLFYDSSDSLALIKNEKFIDCNNSLLKYLAYESKDEFLNLRPSQISPEFQPDGQKSIDKETYLINKCKKEGKINFEWVHKKRNDELIWVDVSLTKVRLNDEDHVHVSWRDITEKKQLSQKLQERKEELEETNDELNALIENLKKTQNQLVESGKMASLGGLVAGVAHEIHKPVDVAVTGVSYLHHSLSEIREKFPEQRELLSYIDNTKGLIGIIDDSLLQIASLVNKFQQISVDHEGKEKRSINLKNYINGIILSLDNIITTKKIKIDLICDEGLNIDSYPEDFTLIITNLIANSIEHGFIDSLKGNIKINAVLEEGYLKIIYSNDGKHIDEEDLSKIFEPFFSTSKNGDNPGLGLNIVYNIVNNKLNGNIKCKNKKEGGVEFSLFIPISISSESIIYHI